MKILHDFDAVVGATAGTWQQHLKLAIRDLNELRRRLELPIDESATPAQRTFGTFVPLPYFARIETGNSRDPLLLQVLPTVDELSHNNGFVTDPVGEHSAAIAPGVLQKYAGRVLLVATGSCAVNCRYCFRREFPYSESPKSAADWEPGLFTIRNDPSIHEVILSGGDPLMLVDDALQNLVERISSISHVRGLRIHTRLPIVIPQRVTGRLLNILDEFEKPVVVVLHSNHGRELDEQVQNACASLRSVRNVMLLNQSVLLRDVNDDADVLTELSERLFACGVLPYYLHQLDRVRGAAHFEVPISIGRQLITTIRSRLPGYLVPRYVQEVAGEPNKTILL